MSVLLLFLCEIASGTKEILETSCSYLIHDRSEKKVSVSNPDEHLQWKAKHGPGYAKSWPTRALSALDSTTFEWFSWEHLVEFSAVLKAYVVLAWSTFHFTGGVFLLTFPPADSNCIKGGKKFTLFCTFKFHVNVKIWIWILGWCIL